MVGAAIFFGIVLLLFVLVDSTVVLLRRAGRLNADRWPRGLFNWWSILLGLVLAVLFFIRAGFG